jgi:hypothetical protein
VTKPLRSPSLPWTHTKAARRIAAPDEAWAQRIRDRILGSAHPFQRDAIADPARRFSMLIGRGGTKTSTFRARLALKATHLVKVPLLYFAATRQRAMDLMWFPLKDICEKLGILDEVTWAEVPLRATFRRTGSTIQLSGCQDTADVEKWRGQSFAEVDIDECGAIRPELLENLVHRIIAPRLGDLDGAIGLGGTPGHILRGLFYDVTRPGSEIHRPYKDRELPEFEGWRGWSSHAWTLEDVISLPNAEKRFPALVRCGTRR